MALVLVMAAVVIMIDIAVDIVVSKEAEVESESAVDLEVDVEITLSMVSCFFSCCCQVSCKSPWLAQRHTFFLAFLKSGLGFARQKNCGLMNDRALVNPTQRDSAIVGVT